MVIQKVADKFAPDYNITYSDIKGNAFTGVEIDDLRFQNKPLAQKITLKWNPNALLDKSIVVTKLEIEEANIDVIKALIASFDNNESSDEPFAFTLRLEDIHLSLAPFIQQGIFISKTVLDADKIIYSSDNLVLNDLVLSVDSNVSDIFLKGNLEDQKVVIDELVLKDVDTLALQGIFVIEGNEGNLSMAKEQSDTQKRKSNPLVPKYIRIKKLQSNILSVHYDPVKIKLLTLEAKEIKFDIEKLLVEHGDFDLKGTTNLSNVSYRGKMVDNHLIGKIHLSPNNELFELYNLPIRKEAIGEIEVEFNASRERVVADVKAKAKNILKSKKGEFNLDIDSLLSHVVYTIGTNKFESDSKAMISTPYAKDIVLTNIFVMDNNISYRGEVKAKELSGIDVKFTKPLRDLTLIYRGDVQSIQTLLSSEQLKGSFDSADFKKGQLHLETIKPIILADILELPEELKEAKVNAVVDAPLDFTDMDSIQAKANITSNVVNMDADILYGKILQVKATTFLPQDSLLKAFSKEVKWDALSPLNATVDMKDEYVTLKLKGKALSTDLTYLLESGKVDGEIQVGGLVSNVSGIVQEKFNIDTKITSMKSLDKSISSLYTLEVFPPLEGSADISAVVTDMKSVELSLSSPKLVYKADRTTEHIVNDIQLTTSLDESKAVLKSYKLTYGKQKFFSNKPSLVQMDGDTIRIGSLWLNEALEVVGDYDLKTKQGTLTANADNMHFTHEFADIDGDIDLKTVFNGDKTDVNGNIVLLGGNIKYNLSQKSFATDSDIIIVQDIKKQEASPFMDNLSASIKIDTKKPLVYKQGDVNIQAKVDLSIYKVEHAPLMVLGSVELLEGGTYIFQDKKFVLHKSYVHFTGNPEKPILELKVKYKSMNHLITITVLGAPETPNINFSSSPSLTREQILSVILFDSEAGGDTHSGDDMMKMMGGAMAKSVLSNVGVKLDHLVLGEGNSVEVGKKLTRKITIIYVNDIVSSVKLKYQHSQRTESVIEMSEESQSYDIIYKRDF